MNIKDISSVIMGIVFLGVPLYAMAESYTYDAAGRLTGTTYDDGTSVIYSYDANGNMLAKTVNATPVPPKLIRPAPLKTTVLPGRVVLKWPDKSVREKGYAVERRKGAGKFVRIGNAPANATRFVDRKVVKNTVYRYRVRAFAAGKFSTYSNVVTVRAK